MLSPFLQLRLHLWHKLVQLRVLVAHVYYVEVLCLYRDLVLFSEVSARLSHNRECVSLSISFGRAARFGGADMTVGVPLLYARNLMCSLDG